MLCGIARFYTDRCHFSKRKGKYMIHGVTGPNEYENNVNNNWYTNRIAAWSIAYFLEQAREGRGSPPGRAEHHAQRNGRICKTWSRKHVLSRGRGTGHLRAARYLP